MTATTRRTLVIGTSLLGPLAAFSGRGARAASDAAEIDRDATRALQQLLREDHRAAALAPKSAGTLIFPRVVKAGFIFGGQGGKGALRAGGRTRGYYNDRRRLVWLRGRRAVFQLGDLLHESKCFKLSRPERRMGPRNRSQRGRGRSRRSRDSEQHDAGQRRRGLPLRPERLDGGHLHPGVEDHDLQPERLRLT
jgi:hypothetical protein